MINTIRSIIVLLVFGLSSGQYLLAQKTLFSIDGDEYKSDQFEYLYSKNNQSKAELYTKSSIDEYLDLYINLKLKVLEAESLGLNEQESFTKELAQYRNQVAQSYLVDRSVTDELVKEAYERSKKEVKSAHILISCAEDATPADSLLAYNKAMQIRQRLVNGEDFYDLAKKTSDDPSALQNNGKLGFSTVFRFIYEFENAMYSTPIGEISQPIRTKYGYHLIKVIEDRPSLGQVNVSQIKVNIPIYGKAEMKVAAKRKCDSIYQLIKTKKITFKQAVREFSDDSATNKRGGNLGWLNAGKKGKKFDALVFEMQKDEISEPIRFGKGWYIVKLNELKPIGTYEEMKDELYKKVERNSRSQLAKEVFVNKLKKEYSFKENDKETATLASNFNETLLLGKWVKNTDKRWEKKLFEAGNETFTVGQFADFIMQNQQKERISQFKAIVEKHYRNYVAYEMLKLEDKNLENKYPDFKQLMQEFYDGILMFELTSQKVFQQSVEDTLGQKTFYLRNIEKYKWEERLEAKKYRCANPKIAKQAKKMLSEKDDDLVYEALNRDGKINIRLVKDKKFERGTDDIIDAVKWEKGISRIIEHKDGKFYMAKIQQVLKPVNKAFEEAKSEVINDFQSKLSEDLVTNLRAKYNIKVESKILKKLYKKRKQVLE